METEIKPTNTPWKACFNDQFNRWEIWSSGGRVHNFYICPVNCHAMDTAHNAANAAVIVQAVNAHADLIAALEKIEAMFPAGIAGHAASDLARAALAKAKRIPEQKAGQGG